MGAPHPATAGAGRSCCTNGRVVLLLDAVNELPHADEADYRERIPCWRDFLGQLPAGTRTLFSCRSLDYSASLSTPDAAVTHVRIEQLGDPQVEEFLTLYDARNVARRYGSNCAVRRSSTSSARRSTCGCCSARPARMARR
jgi:hypothetical protein